MDGSIVLGSSQRKRLLAVYRKEPDPQVRLTGWEAMEIVDGCVNVCVEHQVPDVEQLPNYLLRQMLSPGGLFYNRGVKLIIVDSIQGWGMPASASRRYERLLEAVRLLSAAKITTLLISHVTKKHELAGPRTLEHAVDAVLMLRKTPTARLLFCLKNRFGPADLRNPLALDLEPIALRLYPSPFATSTIATARTSLGSGTGLTDVQASISLAAAGRAGRVTAPGLPKGEIQQLLATISQLPGIDLDDLDFAIHCRLPGQRRYSGGVGLALAMALLGSYLQKPIPPTSLFAGEVDLAGRVRPLDETLCSELVTDIGIGAELLEIQRFYVHPMTAVALPGSTSSAFPCERLEQVVYSVWPDLR